MGYLALYRKYRPSGFEGVIGQDHIIHTLVNQIKNDRLGHAYLFTGTRGTGKTSVAKIFAKAINCLLSKNGSPCGECESCKALNDPSNIDVIEIDAASNNGVNEIRDIRENVQYPPVSCKYKVYIIDEVHMLSGAAFNALLKTLEEPPKHAVFILATTEVHKIPATILSRCMRFDFKLIDTKVIATLIEDIYTKEGKKFEKEAVYAIAKAGEGSVRDALSIADIAISSTNSVLTYEDVMNVLGATNSSLLDALLSSIFNNQTGKALEILDNLIELGKSIGVLIKDLCQVIRDLIIIKTCAQPKEMLNIPDARFNEYQKIAQLTNNDRLIRTLEIFSSLGADLRYSNHPRILLETAVIKCAKPDTDFDFNAVMGRISSLEDKLNKGELIVLTTCQQDVEVPKSANEEKEIDLSKLSELDLKGKVLHGLREMGSELLWGIFQTVSLKVNGTVLNVQVTNPNDFDLLNKKEVQDKIRKAFPLLENYEINVAQNQRKLDLDEVDDATEKIKKIFGDDIVIIKD